MSSLFTGMVWSADMRLELFGFELDSSKSSSWALMAGAIVISLLVFFATAKSRGAAMDTRIRDAIGFELPKGLGPEWSDRPSGRELIPTNLWSRGYRLPDALAQELLGSCEARGGQLMASDDVAARYPELTKHILYDTTSCVLSRTTPKRSVSMLHENRLTVLMFGR